MSGIIPPSTVPQPAAASPPAGSTSRKCGSPLSPVNTIKHVCVVATRIADRNRTCPHIRAGTLTKPNGRFAISE